MFPNFDKGDWRDVKQLCSSPVRQLACVDYNTRVVIFLNNITLISPVTYSNGTHYINVSCTDTLTAVNCSLTEDAISPNNNLAQHGVWVWQETTTQIYHLGNCTYCVNSLSQRLYDITDSCTVPIDNVSLLTPSCMSRIWHRLPW